ncbi:hypothetical protein MBLNU13_g06441t1 [Cladosporium sp. NU13]
MLAPSTRATIRPRSLSTSALSRTQTRTLFGWKSRFGACDSHLDPLYPRFIRHRTLKTRAKLLKAVRRRQQFEWDAEAKPFLGPRHVRNASYWDGTSRPRWARRGVENEEKQNNRDPAAEGYELSDKEKEWKKQMDAIRKRIEVDPYEAVFGKRFEPFWTPLVSSWMGETASSKEEPKKPAEGNSRTEKNTPITPPVKKPAAVGRQFVEQPVSKRTEPYTYTSSTSWDSQSNKTRTSEWDSISRKRTNYEYDPVSNRMVPVESLPIASVQQEQADVPARVTWKPIVAKPRSKSEPTNPMAETVDSAAQTVKDVKFAATVPSAGRPKHGDVTSAQPQSGGLDTLTAGDVRASMGKSKRHEDAQEVVAEDWISEQRALKKQIRDWDNSVTKLKNQVSAIVDEVSATQLGQHLPTTLERHAQTPKPVESTTPLQPAVQRMQPKAKPEQIDLDDSAAHESTEPIVKPASVPKDWYAQADILQSDRVKRSTVPTLSPTVRWLNDMQARKAEYQEKEAAADAECSAQNAVATAKLEKANAMLQAEVASQKLAMSEQQDRSSQKIKALRGELETAYKQSSVHADAFRDQIAGLDKELTAAKSNANEVQVKAIKERYSKKVANLQQELERAYVQSSVHADEFTRQIKDLEAELIRLTKAAGDSLNAKPASPSSKLQDLRGEGDFCPNVSNFAASDMWYKQPSSLPRTSMLYDAKSDQKAREKALVDEVRSIYETAYGAINVKHHQPRNARNAALEAALAKHDKHTSYGFKDDGLESELSGKVITAAGDVIKHEKNAYAYKKDNLEAELKQQLALEAGEKADREYAYRKDNLEAELKQRLGLEAAEKADRDYAYKDDGLESALQSEAMSGTAGQPQRFVPDGLEAELVEQSKTAGTSEPPQKFVADDLEAELVQQSKAAGVNEPSEKLVADNLEAKLKKQDKVDLPSHPSGRFKPDSLEAELKRLADEEPVYESDLYAAEAAKPDKVGKMERTMASSLGAELHLPSESVTSSVASAGVQWQQPPLYKVVAYDSGNDRFSTATTTSWDPTVEETPITIAQALSQLYQPARWMQHFASLQRDGYQVVHAREDVLVLKKVQDAPKPAQKVTKPFESSQSAINPVDGTRSSKAVRPVTGDYANPTGYVNLDLVQELAAKSKPSEDGEAASASSPLDHTYYDAETQYSPRIKRQEPVFSGSQRVRNGSRRARREAERERQQQAYQARERRPRSLILWMLGVGAATSGVMYVTGSVAEKARAARIERETRAREAEKVGEGSSVGRWRLDEGEWRKGR